MTKQELGPDDLRKWANKCCLNEGAHICADAWQADKDALAKAEARVDELEEEATAYREAMTLRPMESAPVGERILVKFNNGELEAGKGGIGKVIIACCPYAHHLFKGWLPLPAPINEGSDK